MLVKKPPMGWNTWNTFGHDINEELIRSSADVFVEAGLRDAGYEYVVIDDCWSKKVRDPQTDRLVPEPEKFPSGMKALSDYIHAKGLKFGMYSCAGQRTCADYPGSFDHEFLDAKTFAEWGVDFLKYDFCYKPTSVDGPTLYRRMGMALRASGRDILFSACNWGSDNVWQWIRSTGAHMYRSTGDINDNPESYRSIARSRAGQAGCFRPGMLQRRGHAHRGHVWQGPGGQRRMQRRGLPVSVRPVVHVLRAADAGMRHSQNERGNPEAGHQPGTDRHRSG